jgi:RNA polymerase sigma-70 factor, ECF subfamily
MLGDRADAEEAVQDAFARAYRWLARYQARDRFSSWLFQILVNQCRTIGAKRRRLRQTFVTYDALDDFPGGGGGPAVESLESDFRLEVQRALARLPERSREALLLKYLDDRTYEDIAELLGVRVSAIKMRVKRAREQLQEMLKGESDA